MIEELLEERNNNILFAEEVTITTLVGYVKKEFPLSRKGGNCFSVLSNKKSYNILNFGLENVEELIKRNIADWPIKIRIIKSHFAIIDDERIPEDWYSDRYCEVCTPFDILPEIQKYREIRKMSRGEIKESGSCTISVSSKFDLGSTNKIKKCYKCDGDSVGLVRVEGFIYKNVCKDHSFEELFI